MNTSDTFLWYQTLRKPFWAPPAWLFGPVWSVLYLLIIFSFGFVFYQAFKRKIKASLALPFLLNLVFNLLFTPLQFGLKSNPLALVDILLCLTTLIWSLKVIYPKFRWVALINLPYLLWVTFATILQITVTFLNF